MKTNSNAVSKTFTLLLVAVALAFPAHSLPPNDQVPFKGKAQGAAVEVSPIPPGVVLLVVAEGNATQLGRFSREETIFFNLATGALIGEIVFTAANGDQLIGTVTGGFTSPTTAAGTYTFTGGTGRFENATGDADFALSTSDGVHFTVEFAGTVSSAGR